MESRSHQNHPNREWAKLTTPEATPAGASVRLVVQFNADVAGALSAGHYDVLTVEQYTEAPVTPTPPPSGSAVLALLDDIIAEGNEIVTEINQVVANAEEIKAILQEGAIQCVPLDVLNP